MQPAAAVEAPHKAQRNLLNTVHYLIMMDTQHHGCISRLETGDREAHQARVRLRWVKVQLGVLNLFAPEYTTRRFGVNLLLLNFSLCPTLLEICT